MTTLTRDGQSFALIDTAILKLVRGGTLPAVGALLRDGVSFPMIDTRPLRWHQGAGGGSTGPTDFWNPADKDPAVTLSNNNLTAGSTIDTGSRAVRANAVYTPVAGKLPYFEVDAVAFGITGGAGGVGLANNLAPLDSYVGSDSTNAAGWFPDGWTQGPGIAFRNSNTYAPGDVIGVMYNPGAVVLQFFRSGTFIQQVTAPAVASGVFPACSVAHTTDQWVLNCGSSPMQFMPAGCASWDGTQTA